MKTDERHMKNKLETFKSFLLNRNEEDHHMTFNMFEKTH